MKKMKKKTVIKNKKRFTAFLVTVLVLFSCGFSSVRNHAFADNEPKTVSVIVSAGDTLWDIAKKNNPNKKDVRHLVHEIIEYNHLTSGTIYAGNELLIPV